MPVHAETLPEPIAADSIGQINVYIGNLASSGEAVEKGSVQVWWTGYGRRRGGKEGKNGFASLFNRAEMGYSSATLQEKSDG
jgi:hypothetical protein